MFDGTIGPYLRSIRRVLHVWLAQITMIPAQRSAQPIRIEAEWQCNCKGMVISREYARRAPRVQTMFCRVARTIVVIEMKHQEPGR